MKLSYYAYGFLGILFGLVIGYGILLLVPYLPLPVNSPWFKLVGIEKPRIIGFLPYFLLTRATNNYNPDITTVSYFALTIGSDGHIEKLTNPTQTEPAWFDLQGSTVQNILRNAKKNNLTLSLTVGLQDESNIESLLSNPVPHASNLLSDIIPVMKKYGFSDVNIDIESFQNADSKKEANFITFVKTIKQGIDAQNLGTVTVDIAPVAFIKPYLIDPVKVGEIADYMLVMAYDYHTVISSNTGPIAPISGKGVETEYDVATTIGIAKKEIDPKKIILGIPLYGYEWDSLGDVPGSATIPDTGQTASNRRIMSTFVSSCQTCHIVYDPLAIEHDFINQDKKGDPYFHQAFLFTTSDYAKRLNYTHDNNFSGVALWALGYEGNTLLTPTASYKNSYYLQ